VGKKIFHSQEYLDKKIVGKNARNNFSRNTRMVREKMLEKISPRKIAKNVFLHSHEYRCRKVRGKNARNFFSRNTRIVGAQNVGEKSSLKSSKKRFLYSHEYRDQKMGGKMRKQFFQKQTIDSNNNVAKKIVAKMCEKTFFIFTRIM